MNKKLLIAVVYALLFIIVSVTYDQPGDKSATNPNASFADWVHHYNNADELTNSADLIIKGKKIDAFTEQRVDMVFTKEVIEIMEIFKGDLNESDTITILQTGGELNGIKTHPFAEAPILDNHGTYYFFLEKTDEEHYLILGGYQGIGKIQGDLIRFNEPRDDVAKELQNKTLAEFEEYIKLKLKSK